MIHNTKTLFDFPATVNEAAVQYLSIPEFKISLSFKKKGTVKYNVIRSTEAANILRLIIGEDEILYREHFIILCLNRANNVINYCKISLGGLTGTVADPRIILQVALACNATSLILCHNHPSGSIKPSRADEEVTQRIKQAAALLDIKVLDHIIVTDDSFYSFLDEGLM